MTALETKWRAEAEVMKDSCGVLAHGDLGNSVTATNSTIILYANLENQASLKHYLVDTYGFLVFDEATWNEEHKEMKYDGKDVFAFARIVFGYEYGMFDGFLKTMPNLRFQQLQRLPREFTIFSTADDMLFADHDLGRYHKTDIILNYYKERKEQKNTDAIGSEVEEKRFIKYLLNHFPCKEMKREYVAIHRACFLCHEGDDDDEDMKKGK